MSFSYFMFHQKVTELSLQGVTENKSKLRISASSIGMQFVEIRWLNYLFVKQVTSYFSTFPSLLWITYPISGWMSSVKQRSCWGQPVFCSELRKVVPRSGNIIMIAHMTESIFWGGKIYSKNMQKNNCHPFRSN